jgi:hypothetical protein
MILKQIASFDVLVEVLRILLTILLGCVDN